MSQASGDRISPKLLSSLKAEADARVLDERADDALGWEPRTIDADKRANEARAGRLSLIWMSSQGSVCELLLQESLGILLPSHVSVIEGGYSWTLGAAIAEGVRLAGLDSWVGGGQ